MPTRKIDPQALAAWKGTDAAFAAHAGVSQQAVTNARLRASQAAEHGKLVYRRVDLDALAAWEGSDAEFARVHNVSRAAVLWNRKRHCPRNGAPIPVRKPLGRRVQTAVLAEAARRGVSVLQVLEECRVALVDGDTP